MSLMVTALALMLCNNATFSCSKGMFGQQETDL